MLCVFFFKQKTAYEMRISDWSSDVCSSDLAVALITSFAWREGTLFAVASLWGDGSDSEGGPQAFYAATVAGSRRLPDRPVEAQDRWESVTGGLVLYDYEQPEDEIGRAHV